jgi:gamma-glutamyltranspeptidase/glutathione hydrolase
LAPLGASKTTRLSAEALVIDQGGRGRTSRWGMTKDEVVASAGMVSAGHRLAAEAGVEMLRRRGNAVDAAMAAAWAVGVVEPWMSGAGGVGAMVVHHAGRQVIIDFGLRAPLAARGDMYTLLPECGLQGQYGWPAVKGEENQVGGTRFS